MSVLELKQQFIDKLKRFKAGAAYMDGPASVADKDKWQPVFCELLSEINDLIEWLRQSGCQMSDEEIHRLIENL